MARSVVIGRRDWGRGRVIGGCILARAAEILITFELKSRPKGSAELIGRKERYVAPLCAA